jgi:two-component system sensor histidine kinase SenX3
MRFLEVILPIAVGAFLLGILLSQLIERLGKRREVIQRISAVSSKLGDDSALGQKLRIDTLLAKLELSADRAASAVSESSADAIRLRRTLDSLDIGVIIYDELGDLVFRNETAAGYLEQSLYEVMISKAIEDLKQGESNERLLEFFGNPKIYLLLKSVTLENIQKSLGTVIIIQNVSEFKHVEEVRRDFVANVSHELKTPVGALGLLAETLINETDPAITKRLMSRIQSEAFRVNKIIDDLLNLSRLEAEQYSGNEPVEVGSLFGALAEKIMDQANAKGISLEVKEPVQEVYIFVDKRQIEIAIYNLLDNAVKYSDPGTSVSISADVLNSNVEITVVDHGIGIPAKDIDRIFERFYRVDSQRSRDTGGTGLGLSIVKHAVSNNGGNIEVYSNEGEGSTFKIVLPVYDQIVKFESQKENNIDEK